MEEKTTRDIGKSLPQQRGKEHEVVIMYQHKVAFLVYASHCLEEEFIGVHICLQEMMRQKGVSVTGTKLLP